MEIWQSLRPITKFFMSGFRGQKYIYQPIPAVDLKLYDEKNNEWEAVGPCPQFILKNVSKSQPQGWIQMRINLSFEQALNPRPALYFDDAQGGEQTEKLKFFGNKKIKEFVFFPPHIKSLRFIPCSKGCVFTLNSIEMREVSRWEVYLKRFPDFLWRSFIDLSFSDKVKKAVKLGREQGGLFLIKRLLSAVSGNRESTNFAFHEWVTRFDTLNDQDKAGIRRHLKTLPYHPGVSILIPVGKPPDRFLSAALESVRGQLYPHWEICLCTDLRTGPQVEEFLNQIEGRDDRIKMICGSEVGGMTEAFNSALEAVSGEWVAFLGQGDKISAHALYSLILELNKHPDAEIIYSDEDKIDEYGRRSSPHFKSDWNPDLFYSHNYIGGLLACRTALIKEAGGFQKEFEAAGLYDLMLRCLNKTLPERIRHVPRILYHRGDLHSDNFATEPTSNAGKAERASLVEFFENKGERVNIDSGLAPFTYRVRFSMKEPPPKVNIIIPTRNRHDLLNPCIDSIRKQTRYPDYEITVVDNQSDDPESIEFLNRLKSENIARVLTFDRPYNFSAINNYAASKTESPIICLMNNDIEVIEPDWLLEMVTHAQRPEIGAVGCKLLYPDHTIQHAGVILGVGGVAGHSHRHFPDFSNGYFGRLQTAQNVSAVTAACLVVRRALYDELEGFDERLEVALNDVDFCLRVRELGYRNLWTPHAKLIHHESQSRGLHDVPEKWQQFKKERDFMLERWGKTLKRDPYYNPNLSLEFEDFRITSYPKRHQPWLEVLALAEK